MKKSGIDSTSTVAMVTRMVRKTRLKIGKWPFWSKYKTCNRGINIEHKKYQIDILSDGEDYYSTQCIKRFVWYSLVLIPNS